MIKKKLLALIAAAISLCALSNTGAFAAIVAESWISGDADSAQLGKYIEPFKKYAGEHFDENSFFIFQIGLGKSAGTGLGDNQNDKICIDVTTASPEKLKIAMAQYIDTESVSGRPPMEFDVETGFYGCGSNSSNNITADCMFEISSNSEKIIERPFVQDAMVGWCIYGFQVLNEEDLTAGTTITLECYGTDYGTDNKLIGTVDLDTITYTFTGSGWVTDTDAGYYYMDAQTKYGVIRFLFDSGVDASKIKESGIKYIKGSNITDYVDGTTAAVDGGTGTESAFYGDITQIPADDSNTYYAVAYVTTEDGTEWSEVVSCKPNFGSLVEYSEGGNAQ